MAPVIFGKSGNDTQSKLSFSNLSKLGVAHLLIYIHNVVTQGKWPMIDFVVSTLQSQGLKKFKYHRDLDCQGSVQQSRRCRAINYS